MHGLQEHQQRRRPEYRPTEERSALGIALKLTIGSESASRTSLSKQPGTSLENRMTWAHLPGDMRNLGNALGDVRDLGDARPRKQDVWIGSGWRAGQCACCKQTVLGRDRNTYHYCPAGDGDAGEGDAGVTISSITVTSENFPSLQRILYAHDAIAVLARAHDGDDADTSAHDARDVETLEQRALAAGLLVINAATILSQCESETLPEGLDPMRAQGNIIVNPSSSAKWRVTAAVNLALQRQLASPRALTSMQREMCWRETTEGIKHILENQRGALYTFGCKYGCDRFLLTSRKSGTQHECPRAPRIPVPGKPAPRPRDVRCGEPTMRFMDLPLHIARRLWWAERVERENDAPRPSL